MFEYTMPIVMPATTPQSSVAIEFVTESRVTVAPNIAIAARNIGLLALPESRGLIIKVENEADPL